MIRFSRSEGVAVVVLRPLDQAIKDGDFIYASVGSVFVKVHDSRENLQILGTGINSTGSAAPIYAPVPFSQERAMLHAYSQTNRLPAEVDYVELHATGMDFHSSF